MTTTMQDEFEADYCEHSHRLPALVKNCRLSNGSYGDPCVAKAWHWFRRSREMLVVSAPPQPIYDEAAELEKFSTQWKLEGRIYRDKNTRQWLPARDTIEGFQMAERVHALWMGWQACAQSRAKAGENE